MDVQSQYNITKIRKIKNGGKTMEEILKRLGISQKTIDQMEEICPNIKELGEKEITEKIDILKKIKCDEIQVRNIISSNAMYLEKSNTDIEKLINKMHELGFEMLNILFDGNPYILNLEAYEIENYIQKRQAEGEELEDIVDEISSDPSIFTEI